MTLNPPFWVGKYATERMLIHEPDEGRFYEYGAQRGLWCIDSEDAIRWKLCGDFKKVADEVGLPQLETKRTNQFLQSLVSLLKGCTEKREAFRREAGVIHLLNGMLDLRVEPPILTEFSSAFMSRNQIPVALDEAAKCPRFENELLKGGIGRQADIDLMQRWAGQCLLGVNLTQTIMLATGGAGTGKSTIINCISQILGTANFVGLRTEHLHQRFELFNYVGKTLLIGADVPGNFLQTEGAHVLKALVGKDVLTAEKKNGESVTIIGDFNVGLTSNSKLKVKLDGDAGAWRRRLMIITYDKPAPRTPNPRFLEELIASEASGILNWMIEGARKLLAELKVHGRMQLDQVQRDRVDSLLSESDSLREFARNGIAPVDDDASVTTMELVEAYVHFCEARGWNPLPTRKVEGTLPDFIMEIHRKSRRNDIKRGDKDARGYRGLRIVPVETDREADVAEAARAQEAGGAL
jgi:P4 family phage/plasmid primase-like protien